MTKNFLIAAAIMASIIGTVSAQGITARGLFALCSTEEIGYTPPSKDRKLTSDQVIAIQSRRMRALESIHAVSQCISYLRGFVDGIDAINSTIPEKDHTICVPAGVTGRDLQDVFLKSYRNLPEKRHLEAAVFFAGTLAITFTCANSRHS